MNTKRNLWPYGILLTFALFISGIAVLIVIACTNRTDLITADYYADELKYQSRLDQLNRTAPLGGQVDVSFNASEQNIRLALPAAMVAADTSGRIQLYRPSKTDQDVELPLRLDIAGAQIIDAAALLPGLWKVRVYWSAGSQDYFADKSIIVKRGA
jgi:nitrogen fixation protein FixH